MLRQKSVMKAQLALNLKINDPHYWEVIRILGEDILTIFKGRVLIELTSLNEYKHYIISNQLLKTNIYL